MIVANLVMQSDLADEMSMILTNRQYCLVVFHDGNLAYRLLKKVQRLCSAKQEYGETNENPKPRGVGN